MDCYAQNPNIEINLSKELLDLLNNKFSNAKLRKVIETIANHKYSYLEWNELESSFISILEKDESYFIKSIFVPLCNQYLIENKYYVEEEFYEVFDKIYSLLKDDNNISVMKNTASLAFDYGLVNFKKYN